MTERAFFETSILWYKLIIQMLTSLKLGSLQLACLHNSQDYISNIIKKKVLKSNVLDSATLYFCGRKCNTSLEWI